MRSLRFSTMNCVEHLADLGLLRRLIYDRKVEAPIESGCTKNCTSPSSLKSPSPSSRVVILSKFITLKVKRVKATKRNEYPKAAEKQTLVPVTDTAILHAMTGDQDEHLRVIERTLEIKTTHTHEGVALSGLDTEVDLAEDLLLQMKRLIERGERFFAADVERSIKQLAGNRKFRLEDLFVDQVKINGRRQSIVPKTPRQREYLDAIKSNDLVFGIGPAGTRSYLAMSMAVAALLNKDVKRIVLTRPAVEAGEKLGFYLVIWSKRLIHICALSTMRCMTWLILIAPKSLWRKERLRLLHLRLCVDEHCRALLLSSTKHRTPPVVRCGCY